MNIALASPIGGAVGAPQASAVAIGEWVTAISQVYRRELDKLEATLWVRKLSRFSPGIIEAAFGDWIEHESRFPTIADIVDRIDTLQCGGVEVLWTHAYQAAQVASGDAYSFVVFDDPRIHFAIDALGGWSAFQERVRDVKGFSFTRRDFGAAFKEYRAGQSHAAGFGYFNGQNVVLIGDAHRAQDVYAAGQRFAVRGVVPGLSLLGSVQASSWSHHVLPPVLLAQHLFSAPSAVSSGPMHWEISSMQET